MPVSSYKTKDGYINIAASGDLIWGRLARAVGKPEWLERPEFKTDPLRCKNRDALRQVIDSVLPAKTSAEWIEILNKADVPCGPINTIDQVFEDPQVKHLGIAGHIQHPVLGDIRVQNQPVKLSRTPASLPVPTPELGEHTDEILGDLGLSAAEIASLREAKVI